MRQLANWFRRGKLESNLDRELRYHLDRRTSDLEKSGWTTEAARRQAQSELGGLAQTREDVRDVWLTRWLRDLVYDLRFSARVFFKMPSFTLTAVLSLMLGIGATTAIYSLVDQILLQSLPVREPSRLVLIDWQGDYASTSAFGSWNLMSYPLCQDLDGQRHFFEGVFCRALTQVNLSTGGDYRPATAEIISGNYFSVLGVRPALGSVLTTDDGSKANSNPVAVLSYEFWKTSLGGRSDVVGRKLLVNRHPLTVIGVAAKTFRGIDAGEVPSVWIPASMSSEAIPGFKDLLDRRVKWMQILGRLKPEITLQEAQAGLQPWFKAMLREDMERAGFPVITAERRQEFLHSSLLLTAAPQGHSLLKRQLSEPLWMLLAVTAVLLGLACLNVSGLILARGSARERETATRLALGASRGRLGRQLVTDSLLLALAGGALGTAAAPLVVQMLISFLARRNDASVALHAGVDWRLLLFALVASVAAGIVSGLAPAWQSGQHSFVSALRERSGTAWGSARLRKVIVSVQIGMTLMLLVGAALFVRTLNGLVAKGPGFVASSLVSFDLDLLRSGYSEAEGNRLIRKIDEAVRLSPTTQASAVARFPLLTGGSWMDPMTILAGGRMTTDRVVNLNAVTPGFFEAMGIKMIAGRKFDEHDVGPSGDSGWRSAIVNEAFVKRYLKNRNPLGVQIAKGSGPDVNPQIEIVGVMSNFSYRGLREDSEQAFFPFLESEGASGTFYVRVRGTAESSFKTLRDIVRRADATVPMANFRALEEQLDRSLNTEHMLATLSSSFGVLALLLSLVGLYGVMSFVVTQRTREIGIRLALGARQWSAIWLVLRDALAMILSGIAIGLPLAWVLGRVIESQLYEVQPSDPGVIVLATVALCLAGLAAALIPARRASGVNPVEALRVE